jgi:hypothetical protein
MSLFGKGKGKGKEAGKSESLRKDKRVVPLLEAIDAMMNGDKGEIMAALSKAMQCSECEREYSVREFLQPVPGKKGWLMTKCPSPGCDADPIVFGPKDQK